MNSWYIAWNVIKRTLGHRKGMLLHLIIPVLTISILIGFTGTNSVETTEVAYLNADTGPVGGHIIRELQRNPLFKLTEASSEEELKERVLARRVQAAFLIPQEFSTTLQQGNLKPVQQWELTLTESTISLRLSISQTVEQVRQSLAILPSSEKGAEELRRVLLEAEKHRIQPKLTDYQLYVNPMLHLITGFLILFLMGLVNSSVSSIMEDRRGMTMARMYAAPIRAFDIAFGNFLGSFALGTLQILAVLLVTRYVVGFHYGLGFFPQLLIMECFLLAVMGLASVVAGSIRSIENISAINSMVATPTCMLGGCFWPVAIMPEFMQKLSHFVPQSWAINAMNLLASGQSVSDIALHLGVLLLFSVVLLGLGSTILKPSEA